VSAKSLSDKLLQIVQSIGPRLATLDDKEDLERKDSPTKWSKKEILGHLIDSAYNNHRRFKVSTDQEHLVFDGYDQDNEVRIHQYQQRDYQELVEGWKAVNTQLTYLIASLPDDLLIKESLQHNFYRIGFNQIAKGEKATLEHLIKDYIDHLEHHLGQIMGETFKG
jgi:hypothetical protein